MEAALPPGPKERGTRARNIMGYGDDSLKTYKRYCELQGILLTEEEMIERIEDMRDNH